MNENKRTESYYKSLTSNEDRAPKRANSRNENACVCLRWELETIEKLVVCLCASVQCERYQMIFCMRYGNHIHQPSQCSFIFHTISSTLSLFYRTSVGCVCVYVFLETFNGTLLSFVLINSIAHDEKSSPFCLFYSKHRIVPFIVILDFYSFIFKYHWNIQATVESKNETKTRTTSIVTIISNCIPISMQQWRKKNEHKTFNSSHIPWINTLSSQCVGRCVHFFSSRCAMSIKKRNQSH